MTEQIGKVKLDLSFYPGEDFYCDGTVEDEILDIVKKLSAGGIPEKNRGKAQLACVLSSFAAAGKYCGLASHG